MTDHVPADFDNCYRDMRGLRPPSGQRVDPEEALRIAKCTVEAPRGAGLRIVPVGTRWLLSFILRGTSPSARF
jgi:hypothetical protein